MEFWVDGRRVNTRYIPKAGEVLTVRLSDPERRSGIVPAPGPLDIVYEDQTCWYSIRRRGWRSTPDQVTLMIQ